MAAKRTKGARSVAGNWRPSFNLPADQVLSSEVIYPKNMMNTSSVHKYDTDKPKIESLNPLSLF